MYTVQTVLRNETGLHARPAFMVVNKASQFNSEIVLIKEEKEYNAKSIMGILCMAAAKDTTITIKSEGIDEKEASEALKELINNILDE